MVRASSAMPPTLNETNTQAWLTSLTDHFSSNELDRIKQACALVMPIYAEHTEQTGMPLIQHAMSTASILTGLNMDANAIIATILYAMPRYLDDWQTAVKNQFGLQIMQLVKDLAQIEQVQALSNRKKEKLASTDDSEQKRQIESLRKMLLAMVQDIRVVLIKLAERTQTLRSITKANSSLQEQIAKEVQGVYAPLANRLGVWQLKWEMEDLSLRYLEPKLYKDIAKSLDARRVDREQYIRNVEQQLATQLKQAGVEAEVAGRPKHIYSIINKMRRKQLSFEELFDVRAVRILVATIEDCYTALSVVQTLWQPIAEEFDDYIARPKSNHYRSLHTAVHGPEGLALEVQIRTHEMHHHSELGVAAHWRYKEGGKTDSALDEKIAWLRQILNWKEGHSDSKDLLSTFNAELFQENVYVFTPQGKVIDLPKGATPIDFAYSLHTDLGHRTRGAKVDNHIVPLNYKLQNAQQVEILTNKHGAPSQDWLRAPLGYLKTPSARAKVRHWFRHQHTEEYITPGRALLDKALQRAGVDVINQEKIAQQLHFNKLDECLSAIGRGDITQHQIANAIQAVINPTPAKKPPQHTSQKTTHHPDVAGVILEGLGNLQTNMAKCCKPVAPADIVAYVTRDRGVTVHRQSCVFIKRLSPERHDRLLKAEWQNKK